MRGARDANGGPGRKAFAIRALARCLGALLVPWLALGCTTSEEPGRQVSFHINIPARASRITLIGVGHPATQLSANWNSVGQEIHPTSALVECGSSHAANGTSTAGRYTLWIAPGPRSEIDELLHWFHSTDPIAVDAAVFLDAQPRALAAAREFVASKAADSEPVLAGPSDVIDLLAQDPLVRDAVAAHHASLRRLGASEVWQVADSCSLRIVPLVPGTSDSRSTPVYVCFLEGATRKILFAPSLIDDANRNPEIASLAAHADLLFIDGAHHAGLFGFDISQRPNILAKLRLVGLDGRPPSDPAPTYSGTTQRAFVGDEYLF